MKVIRPLGTNKFRIIVINILFSALNSVADAEPYELCQVDAECGRNERCLVTQEEYGTRQCIPNEHYVPLISQHACKEILKPHFYPIHKMEVLASIDGTNSTELEDEKWKFVLRLLKLDNTETYTSADSSDAGYYLHVVDKTCMELWSGFLVNY